MSVGVLGRHLGNGKESVIRDEVIETGAQDVGRALACLTAAFLTDPFMRWMLPDAVQYLKAFPEMTRPALARGRVHATEDVSGAALWVPPGTSLEDDDSEDPLTKWLDPSQAKTLAEISEQMASYHPDDATWFLPMLGVDPLHQGKGIGTAVLRHGLREIDAAGQKAYLASSNPRNLSLYERHGFEHLGRVQVGSAPAIVPMLRPASR